MDEDFDRRTSRLVTAKRCLRHGDETIEARSRGDVTGLEEPGRLIGTELDLDPHHAVFGVANAEVPLRGVGRIARLRPAGQAKSKRPTMSHPTRPMLIFCPSGQAATARDRERR